MDRHNDQGTLINGSNLHDALAGMIASQKYQALPNGPESPAHQNELDPIMSAYRERARLQLLREDIDLAKQRSCTNANA